MKDHRSPHGPLSTDARSYLERLFSIALTVDGLLPDEEAADVLAAIKWPNGPVCDRCGSTNSAPLQGPKNRGKGRARCLDCHSQLSPLARSPLENEKSRPSAIVAAAALATRHRGLQLARLVEEETGASSGSAARLALRMQELFDRLTVARRDKQGRAHGLKAASAALLLTLLIVCGAWIYAEASSPLIFAWQHEGNRMEFTTEREADESRAEWVARHARATEDLLRHFPPDESE